MCVLGFKKANHYVIKFIHWFTPNLKGTPSKQKPHISAIFQSVYGSSSYFFKYLFQMVFESCKHSCKCCHCASCKLCLQHHKQGRPVWHRCLLHHGPSLFTSSWVIIRMDICTAPTLWLRMLSKERTSMAAPQGAQIPSKKYFCCVHIDNTTIQNLQIEILHTSLLFQANLHFCFGVSFKQTVCCLWIRQEQVKISCIKIHYPQCSCAWKTLSFLFSHSAIWGQNLFLGHALSKVFSNFEQQ